ncbi:bifunctional diguanylate cyclase/phosphodiesterase [Dechloromonas sp. HYN0024]|uniref:putative bifunctional diguanylate cyclase/phosphodiesterase n=1 Tax=Dechloromonas sp. HYN0024 TaxID=2231055 RepID=UPI000E4451B1|nr:EAL domain-containing protein [Dechloromonas sp. HYN0024]AXS79613.1 EAL domain-containing protein [Dechloromonas sp. HYN0024]
MHSDHLLSRNPPGTQGQLLDKFNLAQVGLLCLDKDLRIREANALACTIAACPGDALIGQDIFASFFGQHDEATCRAVATALRTTGYWNGEISLRRPDGSPYTEQISIADAGTWSGSDHGYLAIITNYTCASQAREQVHQFAHFDALTGLPNRLLLMDRLEQIIAANRRTDSLLAICFIDLDGFKHVNDSLGHDAGDALLIEIARRMQASLRSADTVARIGGDEFIVLLSVIDSEDECYQTIERLLKVIAEPCTPVAGAQIQVSASIGVTIFPDDDSDGETLIRHADHAMYAAKRAGKNSYCMFDARMEQRLEARQDTLLRVSRAMRTGQFELQYQPTLDVRSGRIVGVEALIRWNHPVLGCLLPGEFIPLIEDNSAALELGEWVIREALRQCHAWHQRGLDLDVNINLFARQLQHPGFPAALARMIAETWPDMPSGRLILDIAEPTTGKALESAQTAIRSCRALGANFHLDQFGARDSALKSLRSLDLDGVKIYRTLINDMPYDRSAASLVEGIVGLCQAFGLSVTAVGVANEDHRCVLSQLSCDFMQGNQISSPLLAPELEEWLASFSSNASGARHE